MTTREMRALRCQIHPMQCKTYTIALQNYIHCTDKTCSLHCKIIRYRKSQRTALVEIRVRDYGLGIPPEQAPLLFNRFTRLPRDLASSVQGSGSGLYLCKVLTESMGGTIRVESSGVEGEGATFILRLPLASLQTERQSHSLLTDQAAPS